jgi:hypothetical protein
MTELCVLCKMPMDDHQIAQVSRRINGQREFQPIGWRCPNSEVFFSTIEPTARDRSKALHILRGAVRITPHPYESDPYSGAGNCWCGRPEVSSIHAKPQPDSEKAGAQLILEERIRQITEKGYDAEHDRHKTVWQFVTAAAAYLGINGAKWPWSEDSFKKIDGDGYYVKRNLVKAGALIAAAIDRMQGRDG